MQPKLRFKGDIGVTFPEWKKTLLLDIAQIVGGGTPSTENEEYWNGNINWFTPSEIKDKYTFSSEKKITKLGLQKSSAKILPIGSILFTSRASIGEKSISKEDCCTNQGFQSLIVKETFDRDFIYYSISHNEKKFHRLAQGSTFKEVYKKDISKIIFFIPHLIEQQKIASFLSSVDKKIELLTKKHELLEKYKKGLMQKIFSQEMRFKQDDGSDFPDWDSKQLGDVLTYEQPTKYIVNSIGYQDHFETPVLTAGKSFILGYTDEKNNIFKSLPVIIFDDFTTSSKFVNFQFKVKSSAMKILKLKSENNLKLLFELMQSINFLATDHKRYWISEYQNIFINLPTFEEQQKIASFLSSVDKKIDLAKQQIEKTQTFKKGLLQQMFV